MENHPIAEIFPMMSAGEIKELAEDIRANGLKLPVYTYEGKILDGRNRYRACLLACVTPRTVAYDGDSPTSFVVSLNLKRRQLTPSQAAAAAVEALPWFEKEAKQRMRAGGGDKKSGKQKIADPIPLQGQARDQAASQFHVNRQYVSDAKAIKEQSPEKFEDIKAGRKSLVQVKRELARVRAVEKIAAAPGDKYRVIYADPPWQYGDTRNGMGSSGAEAHYPTMSISELCALPVSDWVEKNAVLFLWVTSPLLFESV